LQIEKGIRQLSKTLKVKEKKTPAFFLGDKNKKPPKEYNYLPRRLLIGTFW
jgi:hypothetical protein